MILIFSKNKVLIRMTQERWEHISNRHPELETQRHKVIETVSDPDRILRGDFGELLAVKFYPSTPLTSKYMVVAYKEVQGDGFILTAYFTNSPSTRRQIIWKR